MSSLRDNIWWGPPRKFLDRVMERRISWLELFYDLVYVGVISQLTTRFAEHCTAHGLMEFLFYFCFIFWSWMNGSYYHDLHGSAGIRTRYYTLLQMLGVAAVGIALPYVWEGEFVAFSITFGLVQILITWLWFSVGYYDPEHRPFNRIYTLFYGVSICMFLLSIWASKELVPWLWGIALFMNYAVFIAAWPNTTRRMRALGQNFMISNAIVERLGLFTIIVLGESILGIMHGAGQLDIRSANTWIEFALCTTITFLMWWIYFDILGEMEIRQHYSSLLFLIIYFIPLLAAFACSGISFNMMLHAGDDVHDLFPRLLFGGCMITILLSVYGLHYISVEDPEDEEMVKKLINILLVSAVAVIVFLLFGLHLPLLYFLLGFFAIFFIAVYIGTKKWFRHMMRKQAAEKS
ncbi:MAG: low temperature requirement protein A [Chitinophagales bacterium]